VWRSLLSFTEASKAKMIFGLSYNTGQDYADSDATNSGEGAVANVRSGSGSGPFPFPWDPTNARAILQWTIDNKLDRLLAGLELGNEQNDKYSGAQQAASFKVLHDLTVELWPDAATRPVLFGPDPHSYHHGSDSAKWITDWLDACKKLGVPIHAATHHEYSGGWWVAVRGC
jgi:hypothetical protein